MLPEDKRLQLDNIVKKMVSNKESDTNIKTVIADFKQKYASTNTNPISSPSVGSGVSVETQPWYQKPIASASPADSMVGGALKTAVNVIGDIPNTVKGFFDFLNPIPKLNPLQVDNPQSIAGNIGRASDEIYNAYKEGTLGETISGAVSNLLPETVKSFVPQFIQQAVAGDFEGARQTITNHPTSEILPMLLIARGVAEKTGSVKQFDTAISKIASPVTKTGEVIGGGIKTGIKEIATGGVGTATGKGKEAMTQALKGGEEFTKALRGKTDLTQVLTDAQAGLKQVKQIRGESYQTAMNNLKVLNPQSLDISPIASKARELLKQFNVKETPQGYDFSRSSLINDSKKVEAVINTLNNWGMQQGDRTVAGVDTLKRQIREFREPTNPTLNKFVDTISSEAGTVARQAKGYDAIQKEYGQYSDFIDELSKTLSLKESATPDVAMSKLNSLLRDNADYRRQLAEELKSVTGKDILAPIAGKALSGFTPQGLAKYAVLGAGITMPNIIPFLAVSSPRLMGEFFRLVGMTNRAVAPILGDINNFRATTGLAPIKLKVEEYIKNPKMGMSIEDVSKKPPVESKVGREGIVLETYPYGHGEIGKTLELRRIEIPKELQKSGIGTQKIVSLFEDNPKVENIVGYSLPESKGFFEKIGAKFIDNNRFSLDKTDFYNKTPSPLLQQPIPKGISKEEWIKGQTNKSGKDFGGVNKPSNSATNLSEYVDEGFFSIKKNAYEAELPITAFTKKHPTELTNFPDDGEKYIGSRQSSVTPRGLKEWMNRISNGERPVVLVGEDSGGIYVKDGYHRLEAYRKLGIKDIPIIDNTGGKLKNVVLNPSDLTAEQVANNLKETSSQLSSLYDEAVKAQEVKKKLK